MKAKTKVSHADHSASISRVAARVVGYIFFSATVLTTGLGVWSILKDGQPQGVSLLDRPDTLFLYTAIPSAFLVSVFFLSRQFASSIAQFSRSWSIFGIVWAICVIIIGVFPYRFWTEQFGTSFRISENEAYYSYGQLENFRDEVIDIAEKNVADSRQTLGAAVANSASVGELNQLTGMQTSLERLLNSDTAWTSAFAQLLNTRERVEADLVAQEAQVEKKLADVNTDFEFKEQELAAHFTQRMQIDDGRRANLGQLFNDIERAYSLECPADPTLELGSEFLQKVRDHYEALNLTPSEDVFRVRWPSGRTLRNSSCKSEGFDANVLVPSFANTKLAEFVSAVPELSLTESKIAENCSTDSRLIGRGSCLYALAWAAAQLDELTTRDDDLAALQVQQATLQSELARLRQDLQIAVQQGQEADALAATSGVPLSVSTMTQELDAFQRDQNLTSFTKLAAACQAVEDELRRFAANFIETTLSISCDSGTLNQLSAAVHTAEERFSDLEQACNLQTGTGDMSLDLENRLNRAIARADFSQGTSRSATIFQSNQQIVRELQSGPMQACFDMAKQAFPTKLDVVDQIESRFSLFVDELTIERDPIVLAINRYRRAFKQQTSGVLIGVFWGVIVMESMLMLTEIFTAVHYRRQDALSLAGEEYDANDRIAAKNLLSLIIGGKRGSLTIETDPTREFGPEMRSKMSQLLAMLVQKKMARETMAGGYVLQDDGRTLLRTVAKWSLKPETLLEEPPQQEREPAHQSQKSQSAFQPNQERGEQLGRNRTGGPPESKTVLSSNASANSANPSIHGRSEFAQYNKDLKGSSPATGKSPANLDHKGAGKRKLSRPTRLRPGLRHRP